MFENLKNKRKLAYLLNEWDDKNLEYSIKCANIPETVIHFFKTESELIYPAKSIFVGIIYAKCMEKYFNINFYDALNDKELLPDDPYFNKYLYSNYKGLYDYILKEIGSIWKYKSIKKTVNYFKKEFLICN